MIDKGKSDFLAVIDLPAGTGQRQDKDRTNPGQPLDHPDVLSFYGSSGYAEFLLYKFCIYR